MIDREAILQYVLEHDYTEWTVDAWINALDAQKGKPEDSEEYKRFELLQKQREAKEKAEKAREKAEQKAEQKRIDIAVRNNMRKYRVLDPNEDLPYNMVGFAMSPNERRNAYRTAEKYPDPERLAAVLKELMIRHEGVFNLNRLSDLCYGKISESTISKSCARDHLSNRDQAWIITLALKLNEEEAERFFGVSGFFYDNGSYPGTKSDTELKKAIKRDILLHAIVKNGTKCNLNEIDEFLMDMGYDPLGEYLGIRE